MMMLSMLSACATPYQESGLGGGYEDQALDGNRFKISVRGNSHTDVATVEKYFRRRANEIVAERGYDGYRVLELHSGMEPWLLGPRPMARGIIKAYRSGAGRQVSSSTPSGPPPRKSAPQGEKATEHGMGSGFVISQKGHILTNFHVAGKCREVYVSIRGKQVAANVLASDSETDLALLKISTIPETTALFREGRGIRPGEEVIALGYPLRGLLAAEAAVTTGTVSALAGIRNDRRFIQVTAPIQHGNSGGPLVDQAGNVVGVIVATLNAFEIAKRTGNVPQNVNFAISEGAVRSFLDTYAVPYGTAGSSNAMTKADAAAQARKFTVPVDCWN